jgi:hypothetical protein
MLDEYAMWQLSQSRHREVTHRADRPDRRMLHELRLSRRSRRRKGRQ